MTEKDQSDPLASNAARNILAAFIASYSVDLTEDEAADTMENAERIAGIIVTEHTITWEHTVNDAGVAVRRYVARSAWEVDPNPPKRGRPDLYTLLAEPGDPNNMP